MKKARVVEIPESPMPFREYKKLSEHLHNSAMWYIFNAPKSERELRDKFVEKGFPTTPVSVEYKDGIKTHNFIDEEIDLLKRTDLLNDVELGERIVKRTVSSGKGLGVAKQKMLQKRISQEAISEIVEKWETYDFSEAVEKAGEKITCSRSFTKSEPFRKSQVLYQKLSQAGFESDDISAYIRRVEWD